LFDSSHLIPASNISPTQAGSNFGLFVFFGVFVRSDLSANSGQPF
jgi:hypothetical protein